MHQHANLKTQRTDAFACLYGYAHEPATVLLNRLHTIQVGASISMRRHRHDAAHKRAINTAPNHHKIEQTHTTATCTQTSWDYFLTNLAILLHMKHSRHNLTGAFWPPYVHMPRTSELACSRLAWSGRASWTTTWHAGWTGSRCASWPWRHQCARSSCHERCSPWRGPT